MPAAKKILLIEDDPDQLLMYEMELTKAGYDVSSTKNQADALAAIKEKKPDLVFLDLLLGEEKGRDVLKAIKADGETKASRVVILSNFNQKNLPDAVRKEGAADYLNKSEYVPKELAAKAGEYLK